MNAVVLMLLFAAASSEDAELLLQHGVELRKDRKNDEALAAFEQAYALAPSPRARAQIALAEQALGRWVSAERDLDLALSSPEDAWITKNRAALERALAIVRSHLASVDVVTNVDGAELYVDGTRTSTLPLTRPVRVVAGEVRLEVRCDGYEGLRRSVEIGGGMTAREYLPLVPALAPAAPVAGSTSAVATMLAEPAPGIDVETVAWASIAGGTVLVAAAAVASIVRAVNASVWNDDSRCLVIDRGSRETQCADYRDRAQVALAGAVLGYALGGIAVGTGATLLLTGEPDEDPSLITLGNSASRDGFALSFGGAF
jgi:hypothetical protein